MMWWLSSSSHTLLVSQLLLQLCIPSFQFSVVLPENKKSSPRTSSSSSSSSVVVDNTNQPTLSGSWSTAKLALRNPNCCVVSISGLDHHLSILQTYFCGEDAPSDIDLRMRVRCKSNNNNNTSTEIMYADCENIYNTIMDPPPPIRSWRNNAQGTSTTMDVSTTTSSSSSSSSNNNNDNNNNDNNSNNHHQTIIHQNKNHPCILALQELAQGVCSLADGKLSSSVTDVHMRIVCASNYKAIDPPFHTDKCPLRGYVTLIGPGTEYMERTCQPWEYVALRTFGVYGLLGSSSEQQQQCNTSLKMAKELEFIVMKGDQYDAGLSSSSVMSNTKLLWSRSEACVHRSPPGNNNNNKAAMKNKRVILSLDLADGGDDQEWEERGRKRNWRVGMTQRKSHLVS